MFSQCGEEVGDVSRESKESSYVSGGGRLWPMHNVIGLSRVGMYTGSGDYMSKELETRREECRFLLVTVDVGVTEAVQDCFHVPFMFLQRL